MSRIFKGIKFVEEKAALFLGKGYGSTTIAKEVKTAYMLLGEEPQLAIDIGGNIGNYTAELRRRTPKLLVHTFEPSSENIKKLNFRFQEDVLTKIIPLALSNKSGITTLYSPNHGSGLASLTKRRLDHFNIELNATETVQTIRFEEYWMEQLNSQNIDLVKIDVEGHELDVLDGFGKALNSIKLIQFEFGGCNIDTRTFFQDFWYFFKANSFDIYRITPLGPQLIAYYSELDEFFKTTNYIAVSTQ